MTHADALQILQYLLSSTVNVRGADTNTCTVNNAVAMHCKGHGFISQDVF